MTLSNNWFKDWFDSPYYYLLYFKHNEQEASAFIHHLVKCLKLPANARMLDVACGRGRHSRILASLGFDVTGFDLSPSSITIAKQYENDHLAFYQHDMRLPFRINYFQYAFNLFTSFGYFRTEREHYNSIRTMAQSLQSNGIIVLDYLNVRYAEKKLVHQAEKEISGVNFHLTKWFDETHFYKKIIVEDEKLGQPLTFVEKVRKFTLGDFTEMFSFHNLQIQDVFGDYTLNAYDINNSPRLLMIAKKQ